MLNSLKPVAAGVGLYLVLGFIMVVLAFPLALVTRLTFNEVPVESREHEWLMYLIVYSYVLVHSFASVWVFKQVLLWTKRMYNPASFLTIYLLIAGWMVIQLIFHPDVTNIVLSVALILMVMFMVQRHVTDPVTVKFDKGEIL